MKNGCDLFLFYTIRGSNIINNIMVTYIKYNKYDLLYRVQT